MKVASLIFVTVLGLSLGVTSVAHAQVRFDPNGGIEGELLPPSGVLGASDAEKPKTIREILIAACIDSASSITNPTDSLTFFFRCINAVDSILGLVGQTASVSEGDTLQDLIDAESNGR